ncbi:MAG: phage major capsid protein, partial [Mesorhizobium sp.]
MIHSRNVTRSAAALLAAGAPFCRKDAAGGDDPIEALAKSFGEHIDTVMARLNGTDQKTTSLRDQLAEIRQQLARGTFGG